MGLRLLAITTTILTGTVLAVQPALAQKHGGTLKYYHRDNPPTTSIHEEATISTVNPFMAVFNNLVLFDQSKPREGLDTIVPDLAESWSWSEDGKRITFKLRQGVKWHDGKPFTSKDVGCTFDLLLGKAKDGLRLNPRQVWYQNVVALDEETMRRVRGKDISMIFQEPMTSLNPVMIIGRQITEALLLHEELSRPAARRKAIEMLRLVRISDPEHRVREYPHQLSGGMRQRAMIAMALACTPQVLIADEPTTALDVTIQAQILDIILELQSRLGTAVILITHDLGVVAEMAQRVIVMYAGRKVEEAPVDALFTRPLHPYTRGLLASVPRLTLRRDGLACPPGSLQEIPGMVPALINLPPGCVFAPRCALADDRCRREYPPYEQKRQGHWVACWHSDASDGTANV